MYMQKLSTCLWFNEQAEEAAKFYTSLFKNSRLGPSAHYTRSSAQASGRPEGSLMTVEFELENQKILGLNGGPLFKFSPAFSYFVACESREEIDLLWSALAASGKTVMPLDQYPWAACYGWTADRFGVQWQLMLSDQPRPKISLALLFVRKLFGQGEAAVNFYTSLFPNSKIDFMARDESTKTIQHCSFTMNGQPFVLMEGPGDHDFGFSEAGSIVIACDTQEEIDRYWDLLREGGGVESECGWLKDRFGISWQVTAADTGKWASDAKRSEAVMKEIMQMKKIDLSRAKRAYENAS